MDIYPVLFGTLSSFWLGCVAIWGAIVWRNQRNEQDPFPPGGSRESSLVAPQDLADVIEFPTRATFIGRDNRSVGARAV